MALPRSVAQYFDARALEAPLPYDSDDSAEYEPEAKSYVPDVRGAPGEPYPRMYGDAGERFLDPADVDKLNAALAHPFDKRCERWPDTLYANIHCAVELFRRFRMRRPLPQLPSQSSRIALVKFATCLGQRWGSIKLESLKGPVALDAELLMRFKNFVPVTNNGKDFLQDKETAELFIGCMFTAALMASTHGVYHLLVEFLCATLQEHSEAHITEVTHALYKNGHYRCSGPPIGTCTPTTEIGTIYQRYTGVFPNEIRPVPLVRRCFEAFNDTCARGNALFAPNKPGTPREEMQARK